MYGKRRIINIALGVCAILLFAQPAFALRQIGNDRPVRDHGWPAGSVKLANLPTRTRYLAGPTAGRYEFEYHGENTTQFNEALAMLGVIDADRPELIVHNGPKIDYFKRNEPKEEKDRIDWTFTVWNPQDWDRLFRGPRSHRIFGNHPNFGKPVAPPRIDVYVGAGAVTWENVKVPENIVVIDKRPGSVSPEFAGKGLIRASVVEMTTNKPIGGADVVVLKRKARNDYEQIKRGKTDKQGFCQIAQIPAGHYEIRILADGYVPRTQGSWSNDLPEYLKFGISLARPECVRGAVTDDRGKPLEGVKVSAREVIAADGFGYACVGDTSSTTDKLGRFEICALPKGLMSIRCEPRTLHLKNSIFEQYKIPSDNIKLVMTGTGAVWGKVIDRTGNRPSGQIVLELEPKGGNKPGTWGYSGHLSDDGSFNITGIPPGKYVVNTRPNPGRSDYEPNAEAVTVEPGKTYEIVILHEDVKDKVMTKIRKFIERRLNDEQ
jgi:hypothetical protein